jgi:hypothetical protein
VSKGSKPRPIDKQSYGSNYDKIFGKKPIVAISPSKVEDLQKEYLDGWVDYLIKKADKDILDGLNKPGQ